MSYRYNSRRSNYYYSRHWHPDGGANDEGFYQSYCYACNAQTEHESGSCCACHNKRLATRRKK